MSIFYLEMQDGSIYKLDCSETFTFSESGSLTEYQIESGATVSDHYVNENMELSLSGVISDTKMQSSASKMTTDEFISGMFKHKQSGKTFKVYYRAEVSSLERFFDNVLMTNLSFNQDSSKGYVAGNYAYAVSISMKQIKFAQRATISKEYVPKIKSEKTKDSSAPKKEGTATTEDKGKITDPKTATTPNGRRLLEQVERLKPK